MLQGVGVIGPLLNIWRSCICSQGRSHIVPQCLQAAQEKHLQRDLSPILLCALVNNNARCYNESMDFAEHMNEILPESLKVSLSRPENDVHGHTV